MVQRHQHLQDQRVGSTLEINRQEIQFSLWPTCIRGGSYIPQTEILTKNPWEAIESAINYKLDKRSKKCDVCISFLYQARDFYIAYETARIASRPLLLYYSFLNLAKTLIVYRNSPSDLANATHGLSEDRGGYSKAIITARPDNKKGKEVYDLFSQALGNPPLNRELRFRLSTTLLPQILIGHRLWAQAANKSERFIRAERISFLHNASDKTIWIIIDVKKSDLRSLNISTREFLKFSGLEEFAEVNPAEADDEQRSYRESVVRLEQKSPTSYTAEAAKPLHELPNVLRDRLWCIMRTVPAYRRYYFWASPALKGDLVYPLLSVYLVIFYLGSVTRYRPSYFEDLQTSPFGNLFDEIIQTQGQQMLFHLAAEFQERDVSWPAVL
jgi:hypothetical protein